MDDRDDDHVEDVEDVVDGEDDWSTGPEYDDEWSTAEPASRTGPGAMVAAGVVGAVAALLLVLLWNQVSSGDDAPATAARAGATDDVPTGLVAGDGQAETPPEHHGATRLSRCVKGDRLLQDPLEAAQASLDQWSVHIDAMNKLVVGEISLRQATQFWEDTRLGAQRRVRDFQRAVDDVRRQGVDCPDPDLLAPGARALPSCARSVQADLGALRAAGPSIATWAEHVHHMDMLRLGQMTPEQATSAWLVSWRQGARELAEYEVANRRAERADGCARASVAQQ